MTDGYRLPPPADADDDQPVYESQYSNETYGWQGRPGYPPPTYFARDYPPTYPQPYQAQPNPRPRFFLFGN